VISCDAYLHAYMGNISCDCKLLHVNSCDHDIIFCNMICMQSADEYTISMTRLSYVLLLCDIVLLIIYIYAH
jgi:hypothetical protein